MSEDEITKNSILKQNWHLMLLCVGLIVAGIVLGFNANEEVEAPIEHTVIATSPDELSNDMAEAADKNFVRPFDVVPKQEKEAKAAVIKYEQENTELGSGPEVEKNLYRLGNIHYSMLFDYEKAVFYYQKLVDEYPKTDKIQMAYVALADSYGKMNNYEEEMNTYDKIMEKFPENSPAYQFAHDKLRDSKN